MFVLLTSCSLNSIYGEKKSEIKIRENFSQENEKLKSEDQLSRLASLAKSYVGSNSSKKVKVVGASKEYLLGLTQRLLRNNELFFQGKKIVDVDFWIIEDERPLYFSLPAGQYFFSTSLLSKYIKSEQILMALLTQETIKSYRGIYPTNEVIPLGTINVEKLVKLVRLPFDVMIEVNQWSYFIMKRSGFDASAILAWIQTQNKNAIEFSVQRGDIRNLTKEEFQFKNFFANQSKKTGASNPEANRTSSKQFYKFINQYKAI